MGFASFVLLEHYKSDLIYKGGVTHASSTVLSHI